MRRKMAMGTLGLMVLLAAAIVSWAQEGAPQGADPGQGQHQFGGGEQHQWGDGPHEFADGGRGQFGGERGAGGPGGQRMGWQRGGRHGFGGGAGLLRMAENPRVRQYLGLTDEQVGRLHKIGVDVQKASVQTRADLELRHIELRELLRADNPDHDAIMQKLDQVNALQGKMEKQRVETMLSAKSVLTPEQQKKIKTFMENRAYGGGPERGHMMERRGGQGRPPGHPGGAPGGSTPKPQEPPVQ
ncbi:MAG TPA: Spy/CpxP family protein refolding chaperone [Terriglobia bacterium]|nr:Spy/CpxP family protein refolding chaperone [Terriglobia bacterium]